jgi:hypothetical protein
MARGGADPRIFLAFRFHVNFYHSYRGDTPDELGFGKDIRIIRRIIEVLDELNAAGVPVRGTWDIENCFSLEAIMPEHCPDIIESLRRRVAEGGDEVQVMSYNNGLISAHTAAEFDAAIRRAITNAAHSGLRDVFGGFSPMVRPQEMMFTPMHLKLYPRHGIDSVSLFYSAVPFNAFSNFIEPLPIEQRFNPLTLTYPGIEETMTLVPAHNHGDVADNISLRWWVKRLRRKQLAMVEPTDLLLLLDADADDDFWRGYGAPMVRRLLPVARGIRGLIESVRDLGYVAFTTPSEYVGTHPPLGSIRIGQDTADGSFDGFASWAEKWSNHRLWTGVERSRILELQTLRLTTLVESRDERREIETLLERSREARLRSLSTTHFGLASPVVNRTRLRTAATLLETSVDAAGRAFERAASAALGSAEKDGGPPEVSLLDYVRGVSTASVEYRAKPSRALVRVPLRVPDPATTRIGLRGPEGDARPAALRRVGGRVGAEDEGADGELLFVEHLRGGARVDLRIDLSGGPTRELPVEDPVSLGEGRLENGLVSLRFDDAMRPVGLACSGVEMADGPFLRSAVTYAGRVAEASRWTTSEASVLGGGLVGAVKVESEIVFEAGGEKRVRLGREFLLVSGLPYLYVETHVAYPETRSSRYKRERARRLEQEYDGNWSEVMPCEIRPALFGSREKPLRVWKHNYLDHVSSYDLGYGSFSRNEELDSFNNHVTHAWVAVTDREKGLLVAQTADVNASLAFCPMRTRRARQGTRIFLNPFGSYHGRQWSYPTAFTGLGRWIATRFADTCDPHAPSYNGQTESFSQLIAPYRGDAPPEEIRRDAEAFAYPYAILSRSTAIRPPPHRSWSYPEAV